MTNKIKEKWYSNGLNFEEAKKLERKYAKIENPTFGVDNHTDGNGNSEYYLELRFHLEYKSFGGTNVILTNPEDIKNLLIKTGTYVLSQLEGKVIEAYISPVGPGFICLSVNE